MYKQQVFTIENYSKAYLGYCPKYKWKGIWEMAHFELNEAKRVAEGYNECAEHPMEYDPIYDQFFVWDEGNEDYDFVKGEDVVTEDGIKHLYPIGAGNWFWYSPNEIDLLHIAEGIEEFIWEYDTYHYMDENDCERDKVIMRIKNQLKELTVFKQIYELYHNEDLSSDEKFKELSKLLTV
jgi:hypothetical protein